MKKVAIIVTRMIPGGASKIVRQIIEGGQGRYDFTLFTGQEDLDDTIISELSAICQVIQIPAMVRNISPIKDYSAYRHLWCEFRKRKFDIVHTHTSKAGFIGRLAATKAGIREIIHSPHGTIYTTDSIDGVPKFAFGRKILQMAERYAGHKTTYLIALSEHEKKVCIELGLSKEANTIVIPNGIDCQDFSLTSDDRINARRSFDLLDDDIVILSIGRLSREKGHAVLVEAFAEVGRQMAEDEGQKAEEPIEEIRTRQACPSIFAPFGRGGSCLPRPLTSNIRLILVGDGPERERLRQQSKNLGLTVIENPLSLDSEENPHIKITESPNHRITKFNYEVIFAGHQDNIKPFLAVADIFVLPSFYEGFGIALIESMAAGLPVIASSAGGLPEIITDGVDGLLFPVGSTKSLVAKIKTLIDSPELRQKIAEKGYKRSMDFTTEKMLAGYFKLYG